MTTARPSQVIPRESSIFSCLAPNSTRRLVHLHSSSLFEEDWLGLLCVLGRLSPEDQRALSEAYVAAFGQDLGQDLAERLGLQALLAEKDEDPPALALVRQDLELVRQTFV